jgi:hypothetical protein
VFESQQSDTSFSNWLHEYRGKRYNFSPNRKISSTFGLVPSPFGRLGQFPEIVLPTRTFKMNKTLVLAAVIAAAALAACGKKEEAAAPAAPAPAAAAPAADASAAAAPAAADASAAAPAADASAAK